MTSPTWLEDHVEADGFRIRYAEAGEGSPLVHLHGGGGLTLTPAHELLARERRVIAFEMPGFGDSPENTRHQAMPDLARTMLRGNASNAAAAQPKQVRGQHEKTVVSLTFDDAYENQWKYAVPLLRSRHVNATFYVITADSDGPYPCCMSWAQLRTLQGEGDDIGSHTVDHPRLTTLTTAGGRRACRPGIRRRYAPSRWTGGARCCCRTWRGT